MKYIFLILFFNYAFCYLIIPLKYLPIYKNKSSTQNEIYNSIINIKLYTELGIGTPIQNIEIPLDFYSNDFYISDNPKDHFNKSSNLFSNIKFFRSSKSISLYSLEDTFLDGNNFYLGEYSEDIFYLNLTNNTKIKLEFYLPIKLKKAESGGVGLLLYTSKYNSERTFLKCIKRKNLIDNYYWNIIYKNDKDIFLLLGNLPHEINHTLINSNFNNKNFNKDDIKSIHYEIDNGNTKYSINVDNIIIIYQNKSKLNFNDIKKIELNYNSGGIKLPINIFSLYEQFFEKYISFGYCFKNEFNMTMKIIFFYCKNEKIIIDEISTNFPEIKFHSNDLNYDFDLDMKDLFYTKDKYIYFLMFFENDNSNNNRIIVGKPFMKKYQFSFEPDKKLIYFYSTKNKKSEIKDNNINNNENKKYIFIIIVIICAFVLILAFIFFLFKFFLMKYMNRSKKAYELEDEYEYIPKNDLTINNN